MELVALGAGYTHAFRVFERPEDAQATSDKLQSDKGSRTTAAAAHSEVYCYTYVDIFRAE
jgi:hypothetical protein